jgi:hypothetical protein
MSIAAFEWKVYAQLLHKNEHIVFSFHIKAAN